jgi:hypothetical protein
VLELSDFAARKSNSSRTYSCIPLENFIQKLFEIIYRVFQKLFQSIILIRPLGNEQQKISTIQYLIGSRVKGILFNGSAIYFKMAFIWARLRKLD